MKIEIKRFPELSTAELYEILRCRAEVFVVEQDCVYQDVDGRDMRSVHIFAVEGGQILSYLRVIEPGADGEPVHIGRVITMKEARRRGLARQLMMKGIEIARTMSAPVELEAQLYIRDFYRSVGFVECSGEYILDGMPHVRMRLQE